MATRTCPHCGTDQIDSSASVCPKCGQNLPPPYLRTTRSPVVILGAVFIGLVVLLIILIVIYPWLVQKVVAP